MGVSRVAFSCVINGRASISAELTIRLGQWLGDSAEVWLQGQFQYDLWHAKKKTKAKVRPAQGNTSSA